MPLSLAEFGWGPARHTLLRIDVLRNVQGKQPEISAWFASFIAHAHLLRRGWMLFEYLVRQATLPGALCHSFWLHRTQVKVLPVANNRLMLLRR